MGKTSTAEMIAMATQKPLFSVSVSDVGTEAKHVEANLSRIFALATKWEAILLMLVLTRQWLCSCQISLMSLSNLFQLAEMRRMSS